MGIFSSLFGKRELIFEMFAEDFDIVGESYYQQNLTKITGGKTEESAEFHCEAKLVPEKNNPHDSNAVKITINGLQVGHLSRDDAADYRDWFGSVKAKCDSVIVGGWDRGNRGAGHFGVKLDIDWPPKLIK
ncbi:MAG: HIRAN domain-containing protein [Rhizobiaceae bacterium]